MKSALLLTFLSVFSLNVVAWDYSSNEGWTGACNSGTSQSPINIQNAFYDATLGDLNMSWAQIEMKPFFNGHTIEVPYSVGSKINFRNMETALKQFHFHAPSEHTLNNKQYAMEVHFVHQDSSGKILVVGVFIDEGKFNATLGDVFDGRTTSAENLLPLSQVYYNYNGSLTTPPCSEGVTWIVMKEAIEASQEQIQYLKNFTKGVNNRPVQAINGREIKTTDI